MTGTFRGADVGKPLKMGLWTPPHAVSRYPREFGLLQAKWGHPCRGFPGNEPVVDPATGAAPRSINLMHRPCAGQRPLDRPGPQNPCHKPTPDNDR